MALGLSAGARRHGGHRRLPVLAFPQGEVALTGAVVIGGGPAGLMAAETLLAGGFAVGLYDAMPSVGRKFLLAGRGGLNITHAEAPEKFLTRYGERATRLEKMLSGFGATQLRDWVHGLGIETFTGTSQRVFPKEMKAAPLLRAWLQRLRAAGLRIHARHRWLGWTGDGALRFATPQGEITVHAAATVLALGGGSWARLGSDGAWVPLLEARGVAVAPLRPANCGFELAWSTHFRGRFAGQPVKAVTASFVDAAGTTHRRSGELLVSDYGVEGSLVYALSAPLRDTITAQGGVTLMLDLLPDHDAARVAAAVTHPRGSRSLSSHLQSRLGIKGIKSGLLREALTAAAMNDAQTLAATIKALPLRLTAPRPLDEAISSAGGLPFEALDEQLMLKALPGVFCAGEMLDWEAPTGGYLLTACFATGRAAGAGALVHLRASG
ncbi:MAG: TIGR03862 family flavoprotein [Burkholderiales bacterium]|nr:TIGR03862 family flavoprotein [Burkholderiales bacterium]